MQSNRKSTGGVIQVLDPRESARIAAGEVIERPSSVVRELLDNAVDAGADRIRVETAEGGRKLIRVEDNGCGMSPEDVQLSIVKHATSKIRCLEDLGRVVSLGFRGEALHAMAAVARVRIVSDSGSGAHELLCEDGRVVHFRAAAGAPGTVVEVSRLFHHTPARREFLRSAASESRAVRQCLVERMLGQPGIAFEWINDGKVRLSVPAGSQIDRIRALLGEELADGFIPVSLLEEGPGTGMELSGYISAVHGAVRSRREQFFLLNGRPVFAPSLTSALQLGYGNQLPPGRYPAAVLALWMDPALLNVNIHPAKREVRFLNEAAVHALIRKAVRKALAGGGSFARVSRPLPETVDPFEVDPNNSSGQVVPAMEQPVLPGADASGPGRLAVADHGLRDTVPLAVLPEQPLTGPFAGGRIAGVVLENYWILELPERVLLVDQHAAHERVIYEKLRREADQGGISRQGLLTPLDAALSGGDLEFALEHRSELEAAGFVLEEFGPDHWVLQEVPAHLQGGEVAALHHLLSVLSGSGGAVQNDRTERVLSTIACRAAFKQGDRLTVAAIREILAALGSLPNPYTCPHGRPAVVEISRGEMEKWFHRT